MVRVRTDCVVIEEGCYSFIATPLKVIGDHTQWEIEQIGSCMFSDYPTFWIRNCPNGGDYPPELVQRVLTCPEFGFNAE